MKVLGVGELEAIQGKGSLKTFGLGSCIALIMIDHRTKAVGMAHIALPDSTMNQQKAKSYPGYFADIAVPTLIRKMRSYGSKIGIKGGSVAIKMVGGAQTLDQDVFKIGERNIKFTLQLLESYGLKLSTFEVGGINVSRTVQVWATNGRTELWTNTMKNSKQI